MKINNFIEHYRTFGMSTLLESIGPVKTDYGTDLKNNKWLNISDRSQTRKFKNSLIDNNMSCTFIDVDKRVYQVYIINNKSWYEFGFAVTSNFDYDKPISLENIDNFSWKKVEGASLYPIFNRVFYVLLEGCKQFKLDNIAFKAPEENSRLDNLYSKMMKQQSLPDILSQNGYKYINKNNEGYYLFKRISE